MVLCLSHGCECIWVCAEDTWGAKWLAASYGHLYLMPVVASELSNYSWA